MAKRRMKKQWFTPQQKKRMKTIGKWGAIGLVGYELYLAMVLRRQRRRDVFNLALQRQAETNKPLYVLGDPKGRILSRVLGPDHDCGDLCIDPRGCPSCPTQVVGRIEDVLPTLSDGNAIIFVADQLSRVDDMLETLNQLQRVSGGDLYIAEPEPWSITAWLRPGQKRRILAAPPKTQYTEWRELPWRPGPSKVEHAGPMAGLRVSIGGRR